MPSRAVVAPLAIRNLNGFSCSIGLQGVARVEITTADKINGAINAATMVLTTPQLYLSVGIALLLLACAARAKRTSHGIPTKVGRLGLVLHWGALLIAVVLLGLAGVLLVAAPRINDTVVLVAGCLAFAATVIWLAGKALRYILTGPSVSADASSPPKVPLRSTSVPSAGLGAPARGPWG
ncbi:hypothetical protein M2226_002347 [Bradyrhizobium elkanii]|nr:hypothetical protein [Bradyrhizobium elkanii]MCW2170350.1 hypothetical protein [Bradyrhizobium elkanii]